MYLHTWLHISVWFWYGFGSGLNQTKNHTKTIPKPYQNQTKTIPQIRIFWFGFWSRTSIKNEPKTNQKSNQHLRTTWTFNILSYKMLLYRYMHSALAQYWFIFQKHSTNIIYLHNDWIFHFDLYKLQYLFYKNIFRT